MAADIARNPRPPGKPEGQLADTLHTAHVTRHLLQPAERVEMWSFDQVSNGAKSKKECNSRHDRANDHAEHLPYAAKNRSAVGTFKNGDEDQQERDRSH